MEMSKEQVRMTRHKEDSLALSCIVMLGAGTFTLTGQIARMTGALFPLAFLAAAVIVSFSSFSHIKISNDYPPAGVIGMYLHIAYGDRLPTPTTIDVYDLKGRKYHDGREYVW